MKREELRENIAQVLEAAAPETMNAYEIASRISPEDPVKNGTLFIPLRELVMAGTVERIYVNQDAKPSVVYKFKSNE